MITDCPCGSSLSYQSCCQPLHLGKRLATSARQLMMSRYAAFVTYNIDYLICTHSPKTRASVNKNDVGQWAKACQWLALEIRDSKTDGANAEVEFIAWYKLEHKLQCHHELSLFNYELIDDDLQRLGTVRCQATHAWYYHSARQPNHIVTPPKRNDLCLCGSGKKFKKCCNS